MLASISTALTVLVAAAAAAPQAATIHAPLEARANKGKGTVYLQGGAYGSCGNQNGDGALIAALGMSWMKNQYKSPYCGRKIKVKNVGSDSGTGGKGNSVTVTVQDSCQACDKNHVDFSVGAWNKLTNNAAYGTIKIEWDFV